MAGNMLMINVGVNSKDAENSLASLEETLKNISKQDAELKVGENLAAEVENARKKYLDMVKMVNSTEGELQKAFAISGLRQTIADVNALNKKIAETGAKIKPIELQSVMFDGKELFDIKGIDKSLDKFTKKLDKDSNDAFANILTTNLGQKFFSKQKNELEKQLEMKNKEISSLQDKLQSSSPTPSNGSSIKKYESIINEMKKEILSLKEEADNVKEKEGKRYTKLINKYEHMLSLSENENKKLKMKVKELEMRISKIMLSK